MKRKLSIGVCVSIEVYVNRAPRSGVAAGVPSFIIFYFLKRSKDGKHGFTGGIT